MKTQKCLLVICLIGSGWSNFGQGALVQPGELWVGASEVDVTPPVGTLMWGYGSASLPAKGVHDPLFARVVTLEAAGETAAVIALDYGRVFGREVRNELVQRIQLSAGIRHVLLTATHTHSGPYLADVPYPEGGLPGWQASVLEKIIQAVVKAKNSQAKAKLGCAMGSVLKAYNRRYVGADGKVKMLNDYNPEEFRGARIDPTVGVWRFEKLDGSPIAILVNYAAHPFCPGRAGSEFSADFPGVVSKHVQDNTRGRPAVVFLQGACGDTNADCCGRGYVSMEQTGRDIGKVAHEVSEGIRTEQPLPAILKVRRRTTQVENRWDIEHVESLKAGASRPPTGLFYYVPNVPVLELETSLILINDRFAIAGFPGEMFVNFQMSLRKRAPVENLLFAGYADQYWGYFPTLEAAVEGSYGADNLMSKVPVGTGERLVNQTIVDIYELQGRLKNRPSIYEPWRRLW